MWALIINGVVHELTTINPTGRFNPGLQWVAVPEGVTPAEGWSYSAGTFSAPAAPPAPTLAQQAATASISGLTISTAAGSPTLTLAATLFPTDLPTQNKINIVVNGINTTGAFPNGASTYPMLDAESPAVWRNFTIAQYKAVAAALLTYVAACDLIAAGNPLNATTLPATNATISV
jgi:hypothetical protein